MTGGPVRHLTIIALGSVLVLGTAGVSVTGAAASGTESRSAIGAAEVGTPRISAYSIQLTPRIVQAGSRLTVVISNLFNTRQCTVVIAGVSGQRPVVLRVRNSEAKGFVAIPANQRGELRVRVSCGKDGSATSEPVTVVGPGEPTQATCSVVEKGFGYSSTGSTLSVGLRVRNSAPSLDAGSVEIALTFRDASGTVVKTSTISNYSGIPAASTVVMSSNYIEATAAVTLETAIRCSTATEPVDPVLPTTASIGRGSDDDEISGFVLNTLARTIGRSSEVNYLVRSPSGAIKGGDSEYLDSFILPGGTGTWSDWVGSQNFTAADGVEGSVFVDFQD